MRRLSYAFPRTSSSILELGQISIPQSIKVLKEFMAKSVTVMTAETPPRAAAKTAFAILIAISFCHLLNDVVQSLVPAIYPLLKQSFHLDFGQIGLITLTFQLTASLLQPLVGLYTDRRPMPYSLAIGMGCTLIGLLLLSVAASYGALLFAAAMVGMGSAV